MKIIREQKRIKDALLRGSLLFMLALVGCDNLHPPARDIVLNPLFGDNMVLQQQQKVPVWGTAEPGSKVTVILGKQKQAGIADSSGNWRVDLEPLAAGGPFELIVKGRETKKINNVMVGEVWLCSGQSNMEMPVSGSWARVMNDKEEVAQADYPDIRLLMIDKETANKPQKTAENSGWKECSPETVPEFSAVAYFFGRYLHKKLHVPIGLIESSWGGTVVEAWTSGKTLKKLPEFADLVGEIESDTRTKQEKALALKKKREEWPDNIEKILKTSGIFEHGYQKTGYDFGHWKTMKLPTLWEKAGVNVDGVVWFGKEVNIPSSWQGKDLTLSLGKINDYDITWFNGIRVGRGTDVSESRIYKIPADIVKPGKNRIVVQVLDIGNVGGLYGPAKDMKCTCQDSSISLVGNWRYKVDPIKIDVHKLPEKPNRNYGVNRPTVLYNAMINPLVPYAIRGVIWYQGESNAGRAWQYRYLFRDMIQDWRKAWGRDFPFLYVQLANFMKEKPQPAEDAWAELREAQSMALTLPNTGMAVTIDIGNAENIHPTNKQEAGRRLALIALAKVYGENIPCSGPVYKSMKIEGNKIYLSFTHTEGGLITKGDKAPEGFAIAGPDKKFVWARARIERDEMVVWSPAVKNPVAVRYAWAANPVCNLYNGAGLPASPFRTDDWRGITYGKK